uniref:Uncharacterized protein n=1 Tax=Lotharella oceanica TaxID=641309 RepID=A0A7S2TQB7_9EUKA|mmetsp:Transcript_24610/g.46001  ORF Transcript_24610/g.46001 Transcript_24610/m.46001 type:complete len:172 (+) Transcript_24610:3-518(+)
MVGGEEKHVNIALPTPPEPIGAILDLPTVPQQRIEDRIREMAEAKLQPQWKQKKGAVVATAPPPPKEKASPDPEISKWRDEGGALVMEDDTRTPEVSPTDEWQDLGGAKVLKDDRPIRSNDNLGGQEVGGARVWVAKKKPPPSALGDDWIEVDGALVYKAGASKKANKGQS